MMVREGLWSNAISLDQHLDQRAGGVWLLFAAGDLPRRDAQRTIHLSFGFRLLVAAVCGDDGRLPRGDRTGVQNAMRFKYPIDPVGGPLMALLAAWVLAAFRWRRCTRRRCRKDAFGGGLFHSDSEVESKSALLAPDLGWLRFVESVSGWRVVRHQGAEIFLREGVCKDLHRSSDQVRETILRTRRRHGRSAGLTPPVWVHLSGD